MADWLELHGLTTDGCVKLLADHDPGPAIRAMQPTAISFTGPELWDMIARVLSADLPELAPAIEKVRTTTVTEFAPDKAKYPRPFTIHDIGGGRIYVSCPCDGTTADILRLAHEYGHAIQITASKTHSMSPVLREVCAYVCESLIAQSAAWKTRHLTRPLMDLIRSSIYRDLGPLSAKLKESLADNDAQYDYDWNYPIARRLALNLLATRQQNTLAALFLGEVPLSALTT
ncbi:hypothetical protein [Falsiruegeria mediterranea]